MATVQDLSPQEITLLYILLPRRYLLNQDMRLRILQEAGKLRPTVKKIADKLVKLKASECGESYNPIIKAIYDFDRRTEFERKAKEVTRAAN